MHPYSIQGSRWRKVGFLMLITVALSESVNTVLFKVLKALPGLPVGQIPPALPTLTLFSILYLVWDKYLWRAPVITRFTNPPNLRGEWRGTLDSSHQANLGSFVSDGGQDQAYPKMIIEQTWTRITVTIYFQHSTSVSTTASFIRDMSSPVLRITYRNTPGGGSNDQMTMHRGTNDLRYTKTKNGEFLEGKYYTDEHRNNHGEVKLKKVD